MKKFNFKTLLVLVLSLALLLSFAACNKKPTKNEDEEKVIEPNLGDRVINIMDGVELSINEVIDNIKTFDVDAEIDLDYATKFEDVKSEDGKTVENEKNKSGKYTLYVKSSLNLQQVEDKDVNKENKIQLEIREKTTEKSTEDGKEVEKEVSKVIFGVYYNGSLNTLFVQVLNKDNSYIKKYIDGKNFDLVALSNKDGKIDKVGKDKDGNPKSFSISSEFKETIKSALGTFGEMALNSKKVVNSDGSSTVTLSTDSVKLGGILNFGMQALKKMAPGEFNFNLDKVNDILGKVLNRDDFDLSYVVGQLANSAFKLNIDVKVADKGIKNVDLGFSSNAFDLYVNQADKTAKLDLKEGEEDTKVIKVPAASLNINANLNKLGKEGNKVEFSDEFPSDIAGYDYFSPFNVKLDVNTFDIDGNKYNLKVQTEINPLDNVYKAYVFLGIVDGKKLVEMSFIDDVLLADLDVTIAPITIKGKYKIDCSNNGEKIYIVNFIKNILDNVKELNKGKTNTNTNSNDSTKPEAKKFDKNKITTLLGYILEGADYKNNTISFNNEYYNKLRSKLIDEANKEIKNRNDYLDDDAQLKYLDEKTFMTNNHLYDITFKPVIVEENNKKQFKGFELTADIALKDIQGEDYSMTRYIKVELSKDSISYYYGKLTTKEGKNVIDLTSTDDILAKYFITKDVSDNVLTVTLSGDKDASLTLEVGAKEYVTGTINENDVIDLGNKKNELDRFLTILDSVLGFKALTLN